MSSPSSRACAHVAPSREEFSCDVPLLYRCRTSRVDMNLGERIRGGTKWLLAGNLGGQVLQFVFGIILARLLAPSVFGALIIIQIYTGLAGFVTGGGTGVALVQSRNVERHHFDVVFTIQLAMGCMIYLAFFSVAPWFAEWYHNPLYIDLFRVSALNFILRPFVNVPNARLQREMRFREMATLSVTALAFTGSVSIGLARGGWGVWALVIGGLAGSAFNAIFSLAMTKWLPRLKFDALVVRQMGLFGLKVNITDILTYLRDQSSNFIVSRTMTPSAIGLYNKADSLSRIPASTVSNAAYQTVFRALVEVQDNRDRSRYIYFRTLSLVLVYTVPFYAGLFWLAEPFIHVVFGEKWDDAALPLQILAVAGLVFGIENISGAVLAARDQLTREIWVQIESWIVLVGFTLVGIRWGISGVAVAMVIQRFYISFRMFMLATRSVGGGVADLARAFVPGAILGALVFCSLLAGNLIVKSWAVAPSQVVYLAIMVLFGGAIYAGAFLFLPIRALGSESLRWKRILRIAKD